MRSCRCYGGPLHGKELMVDDDAVRVEAFAPHPRPCIWIGSDAPLDALVSLPSCDVVTYYLSLYRIQGVTAARSYVRQEQWVLRYEKAALTRREEFDLQQEMRALPWQWDNEPTFLYHFDKWWEWRLHVNGIQPIKVFW